MFIYKIRRKIYKLFHPPLGEILMLHRVVNERSEESQNRQLEITPDFLEQTILRYKTAGYRLVTLDGIYRSLTGQQKINDKFVCFTFDDGFVDTYTLAYPILKKQQCPFVVYITTGFMNKSVPVWWYDEQRAGEKKLSLSPEQVVELSRDPLCTIGAHTVSHPRLTQMDAERQQQEIEESKTSLEKLIGKPVVHFAYPHGDYDEQVVTVVKACGFKTAVIVNGGKIRKDDSNLGELKRILLEE
jgi:peptidoglycan/xylan/chitin deacetylase (PgdA/CDA1 family)